MAIQGKLKNSALKILYALAADGLALEVFCTCPHLAQFGVGEGRKNGVMSILPVAAGWNSTR